MKLNQEVIYHKKQVKTCFFYKIIYNNINCGDTMNRYKKEKRAFDIIFSSSLFVITIPVFIILPILIKLDSKGPIIYKQARIGKDRKKFYIYKFRTMTVDTKEVTRVGKVIRKHGIDELPQIFNVLKGDMSVVGPRPWSIKYLKYFNNDQLKRFDVLPGLMGPTNCLSEDMSVIDKIQLDIDYIDNQSFKEDMKMILKMTSHWIPILKYRSKNTYDSKKNIEKEFIELKNNLEEQSYKKETNEPKNSIKNDYNTYITYSDKPKVKVYRR